MLGGGASKGELENEWVDVAQDRKKAGRAPGPFTTDEDLPPSSSDSGNLPSTNSKKEKGKKKRHNNK